MAKQQGIVPLKGTIGHITFYKTQDGYLARQKGGVDAKRFASDPAFQRTRENGAEFGRAGNAGKQIRAALRPLLQRTADARMISRLTAEMMKVIRADKSSGRGMRNVIDGEAELLQGFEFNVNSQLSSTLYAPFTAQINRASGELSVNIPAFEPVNQVTAPAGATHFKIVSAGAEIDFENGTSVVKLNSTAELPWDAKSTQVIDLVNPVTANSPHVLFVALGVEFYQQVNDSMYPLKNGAFNSLSLVKVSGAP